MGGNGDQPILQDPNFRKALSLTIDRQGVIDIVKNDAIPATSWVSPGNVEPDGTDFPKNDGNMLGTTGDYSADCAAARKLLSDEGYAVPAN